MFVYCFKGMDRLFLVFFFFFLCGRVGGGGVFRVVLCAPVVTKNSFDVFISSVNSV